MKFKSTLILLTALLIGSLQAFAVSLTFHVNMEYETVDPSGVYLAGGSGFGVPGDNPMNDNGDGTWSITVDRPEGFSSHYTFLNGNCPAWNCKENLAGLPCGDPGAFNDRFIAVGTEDVTVNTCFGQCSEDGTCEAPPMGYDVTLQVDMSDSAVNPTGVFVGANWDSWSGGIAMADAGGGIWSVTVNLAPGNYEYKFINGAGWVDGGENVPPACGLVAGEFVNRTVEVVDAVVVQAPVCFGGCDLCGVSAPVDVTFNVDMTDQVVNPSGVYLGTSWDMWSGAIPLADDDFDGIWSVTLQMEAGTYPYKFINGAGWVDGGEAVPMACGVTEGGYTNRSVEVGSSPINIPATCFGGCELCGFEPPATVSLTFNVNMANETVDPSGVYLAGGAGFGFPGDNPMNDNGDGTWSITKEVPEGFSSHYTFLNGNCGDWSCKENLAGLPCGDPAAFNDRFIAVGTEDVVVSTCFGECTDDGSCETISEMVSLTFNVNMANETVDPSGVYLAGGTGFGVPGDNPMNDNGDGTWSITVERPAGFSSHYTFLNGNCPAWNCKENLAGLPCGDPAAFNDRFIAVGTDDVVVSTCFGECTEDGSCPPPPVIVDVTFTVNMRDQVVDPSGVYLGTNWDSWSGAIPLADDDGNGVWEVTLAMESGFYEYKFINGAGWVDGGEVVPMECGLTTDGFTNRTVEVGTEDIVIDAVCFASCGDCPVNVTFTVDMSNDVVDPTGVYLGTDWDDWSGTIALADNGDGTWSVTIPMAPGTYQYKFSNGAAWSGGGELVPMDCGVTTGGVTNRVVEVGTEDMEVPVNCLSGCGACSVEPETVSLTFHVNMANETVSADGVFIAGGAEFGSPGDHPMNDDDGDGVWSITFDVPTGFASYYTFLNGNCGDYSCKENLAGLPCGDPANFNDRYVAVEAADVVVNTCFAQCSEDGTCAPPPAEYDVTFQVDMTDQVVNPTGVYLGASFDSWSGGIALADDDADGIWSVTVSVATGFHEYKFINGAGWVDGGENVPPACGLVTGDFVNRTVEVGTEAIVIDPVCFGGCSLCGIAEPVAVTFNVDMSEQTVHATGVFLGASFESWMGSIALSDDDADGIWSVTVDLLPGNYEYKFINGEVWADGGENVPAECGTDGAYINRFVDVGSEAIDIAAVCYGACESCGFVTPISAYCDTEVTHFGIAAETASAIRLTIANIDATSMYVEIESSDADPVDFLLVAGGSGATISDEDTSVPGKIRRTLTWGTAPEDVVLNVLWSKVSFEGNWQLSMGDVTLPVAATCTSEPTIVNVTFTVDMSEQVVAATGVYLGTNWDMWSGAIPLADNGDGTWSVTLEMLSGTYEYKFINGEGWVDGGETVPMECGLTTDGFTNRVVEVANADINIPTDCFAACGACFVEPETVTITFNVNMENETVDASGVYLAGGASFGIPGDNPMTDDDGDGIYTIVVEVPVGFSGYYTFTNGACGDFSCKENLTGLPCGDPGSFNDRFVEVGSEDVVISTCFAQCSTDGTCETPPATTNVTFTVDMSNEIVAATGVYLGTNWDSWSGAIALSDNGDGTWSVTLEMLPGTYEYKFINGEGWIDGGEVVPMECGLTTGDFTNRVVEVGEEDIDIPVDCFAGCGACFVEPVVVDITFSVDMSNEIVAATGVYLGTDWDGWSGAIAMSDDDGDDVWSVTLALENGAFRQAAALTYQYRFINGADWLNEETVPVECGVEADGVVNRVVEVADEDMMLDVVCFGECTACTIAPATVDVTFTVDMSNETVAATGVYLGTNWDMWSGAIPLSDNGDGTWSVTLAMEEGTYEYKFINGEGWIDGGETVPMDCGLTTDGFTNRVVEVGTENIDIPTDCFAGCGACVVEPETVTITFNVNMENETVDASGVYLAGGASFGIPGDNPMTDDDGDGIYTIVVEVPVGFSGYYTFTNGACGDFSCKENLTGLPCGDPDNFNDRFVEVGSEDVVISTCFAQCSTDGTCEAPPATTNVTFTVDMSNEVVAATGVYLGTNWDSWSGAIALSDNGDGTWSVTLEMLPGTYEYKFINGEGWIDGGETVPMECGLTTGDFTNRVVEVGADDINIPVDCFAACGACTVAPTTVDVTFTVDMSNETVAATGVYLGTNWDMWSGAIPLADNGDGTWSVTLAMEAGTYEYKFINGEGWIDGGETVPMDCGLTTDGFTNRVVTVGTDDITLAPDCFAACGACVVEPETVSLTFNVNMANETVDPTGVYIAGGAEFGLPGDYPMSDDDGDGIWSITFEVPVGFSSYYTFLNGNCPAWDCKENLIGLPCGYPDAFNDRLIEVGADDVVVSTCFGQCSTDGTCEAPPATTDVTFTVDMSNEAVNPTGVYLGTNWDEWSGAIALSDNGDGTWSVTLAMQPGTYEYKFINGIGWTDGGETVPMECGLTTGDFTNRVVEVGMDAVTVPSVCFGKCEACVLEPGGCFDNLSVVHYRDCSQAELTGMYFLHLKISGGTAPYFVSGDYDGVLGNDEEIVIPMADGEGYSFHVEFGDNCEFDIDESILESCTKLAIELLDFTGTATETGNLIEWTTAAELDNDYFTLEHSTDGIHFETITTVDGAGNSVTANAYSFLHENLAAGTHYYRLSDTDFSGFTTSYATISIVRATTDLVITGLHPVPATDMVTVRYVMPNDAIMMVEVYNVTGQLVTRQTAEATQGSNELSIDVSNFSEGMYLVRLQSEGQVVIEKMVKK